MASIKVSDLTATTSTAADSFLYVADTTNGGVDFDSKKITVANFLNAYATEAFVSTQISELINGAPEALNTLKEISDVIGDSNDVVGNLISMIDANETHVDNVATLTGVAKDSADMGSFSGSTIADSSTIKAALQALETSLETKGAATDLSGVISNTGDLVTLSGMAAGSVNLGVFDGDTLSDNATLKVVLQDAEDAIEANASAISTEASSRAAAITALTNGAVANNTAAINQEVTDRAAAITALTNGAVADNAADIVTNAAAITSLTNGAVATNAAAIAQEVTDRQAAVSAEATARADADALLMPKAGGTFTGAISGPAPTSDLHLATKKYADDLVANVDLSQVETNRVNIAAETSARTSADTALSNRLDTLEADPTTATALQAEASTRASGDTALSNRLDTLEADPTTQTLLDAEASTRASADTALSNRVTSLEADPTTQTLLNAETTARTSADTALSGRLDTLEADPTTQTLLDAETAARIAGDALLLPLAGGTMSGAIQLGSAGGVNEFEVVGVGSTPNEVYAGTGYLTEVQVFQGTSSRFTMLHGIVVDGVIITDDDHPGVVSNNYSADGSSGWYAGIFPGEDAVDNDLSTNAIVDDQDNQAGWIKYVPNTPIPVSTNVEIRGNVNNIFRVTIDQGAGGAASTLGVDGTATFGANVTASAAPTANDHLVNKLYADNLVAGVDLSGIATNAAAIEALTNGAPDLLNTLNEIAAAIGDDENFATTITNQISTESTTRASADTALSGRLDVLEADPTTATALASEASTRATADTALSNRLDTLEADPTTQTLLDAETTARTSADSALSGRLDTLEADPTTQTLLTAEATTRANADTALSNRLDTLEADPTTQTLLTAEATTRANADTALSGRLDTLEADPTTATAVTNAIAVETAARQAADALLLPLAGGTMSGAIELGSAASPIAGYGATTLIKADNASDHDNINGEDVGLTTSEAPGWFDYLADTTLPAGQSYAEVTVGNHFLRFMGGSTDGNDTRFDWMNSTSSITGIDIYDYNGTEYYKVYERGNLVYELNPAPHVVAGDVFGFLMDKDAGTLSFYKNGGLIHTASYASVGNDERFGFTHTLTSVTANFGATAFAHNPGGSGGAASTIAVDGTATFGGNVTASAVPTADSHLVNKLYADQLVANVDLSQVETNRLAIIQEIADRTAAITALTNGQVATNATNISANATAISQEVTDRAAAITALTNGQVATNTSGIATNATAITNLTNGAVADNAAAITALTNGAVANNTAAINQEVTDRQAAVAALTNGAVADNAAAITALTNGAVADNTAAVAQEASDRAAADALKVDKQSLVNEHLLGQTSAQSAPVDAQGNSNYLFLVVDKATGALKSIDKTFLEAE